MHDSIVSWCSVAYFAKNATLDASVAAHTVENEEKQVYWKEIKYTDTAENEPRQVAENVSNPRFEERAGRFDILVMTCDSE